MRGQHARKLTRFDRLRWRLAMWLMPNLFQAEERQRLERIARDLGVSRSEAKAIAGRYFSTLH